MEDQKGKKNQDIKSDLEEVRTVYGPVEAELIKNFLESHGLHCLVRGYVVPFIYPFTVNGMAEFKILVARRDATAARDLLAGFSLPDSENDADPDKE